MAGVTEYSEGMDVILKRTAGMYVYGAEPENYKGKGRLVIHAMNEGGHNCTEVDVIELINWLKKNRPELLA